MQAKNSLGVIAESYIMNLVRSEAHEPWTSGPCLVRYKWVIFNQLAKQKLVN